MSANHKENIKLEANMEYFNRRIRITRNDRIEKWFTLNFKLFFLVDGLVSSE